MNEQERLLDGYRALDLTDEKGHLCGKILGDYGADVIKIERPDGDPSRNRGPFYKDIPDPEGSLSWFAFNTSKRGITLDIETATGQGIFRRLASTADLVIESYEPGYMESLSLGYSDLESIRPEIIMTSITPFGQSGPYAHYRATDLVSSAMGGLVQLLGDIGRPPVRMSCDPQAYCQAGIHAALGSMVALFHRSVTGEGQHVDVSMQRAVVLSTMNEAEVFDLMKVNIRGTGQFYINPRPEPLGPLLMRFIFACKDGYVVLYFMGGNPGLIRSSRSLVDWANEEGKALELKDYDFTEWNGSTIASEELDRQYKAIIEFLSTKTKDELFEGAVRRGIMLAPCATVEDIMTNRQLKAREFWVEVEHTELGRSIVYPGAPIKLSEVPWRIQRRAPLIGEHNEEVYVHELGLPREQVAILKANRVV
ncbi:CaiB/BaiF CoA transferase family protein [Chloroflexota bacterium]